MPTRTSTISLASFPLLTFAYPSIGPNTGWSYSTSIVFFPVGLSTILADRTCGSCSSYTGALVWLTSSPPGVVPSMSISPVAVFSTPPPDSRILCVCVPSPSTESIASLANSPSTGVLVPFTVQVRVLVSVSYSVAFLTLCAYASTV